MLLGRLIRPEDSCWTVRGRGQITATIVGQASPGGTKGEDRIGLQSLLLREEVCSDPNERAELVGSGVQGVRSGP